MLSYHPPVGFRINAIDLAVLIAALPLTWWLWGLVDGIAGMVPLVVGHFFLFCNVFRVRRSLELIWAAIAVANTAIWALACDPPCWWGMYGGISPITLITLVLEIRSPRYHGIWAHRLNRHLSPPGDPSCR